MSDTPKPMNAFITMVVDQAVQLAKSDEEANRNPTELAQRIAIGMIQARAQECRHQAGQLLMKGDKVAARLAENYPAGMQAGVMGAMKQAIVAVSVNIRERSKRMEDMALKLAKSWPPTGEEFPAVEEEQSRIEVVH